MPKSGQWICGYYAPAGYVITAYGHRSECGGNSAQNNACFIEQPQDGMWICGFTPPEGYVVVASGHRAGCGGLAPPSDNACQIKKL